MYKMHCILNYALNCITNYCVIVIINNSLESLQSFFFSFLRNKKETTKINQVPSIIMRAFLRWVIFLLWHTFPPRTCDYTKLSVHHPAKTLPVTTG